MTYTLAAAAAACGVSKSTVLRAIKAGKISGAKGEHGEWHFELAELLCVYRAVADSIFDLDPSVPAVDQDYHRKPDKMEKGTRRAYEVGLTAREFLLLSQFGDASYLIQGGLDERA
jgi:hypothetical protein